MADKTEREKRRTPEALQKLLTVDKVLTKSFCDVMERFLPYTKYRKHYKFLEYSCHALPWFFASLGALWLLWNEDLFQTQVNLLFGILIAGSVQWLGKAAIAKTPAREGCFPTELYPSGEATLATFISCFFCYLKPLYAHMRHFVIAWAALVCITRILSCKQSIVDVICGIFLGYISAWMLYHLWLDQYTCRFLLTLEVALTIDCLIVSITKAAVRRRRPAGNTNDMFLTVGIDAYSFPSGHVSRAVMIAYFATGIARSNFLLSLIAVTWATAVAVSRVLMKRHHILDVLGGVLVGLAEGWLVSQLWLSKATAFWLVSYLSDEAVDLEGLQDDEPLVVDD